jgi:hypothetical protein
MSNLSDLLPAGAGGKQVNFVASGTLPSGQTVALKTNGQVEAITGVAQGFGTAVVFESAEPMYISAIYDSTNQKIAIAYRDVGNSNYGTAIVGTVSGTSISFGTAVVFESAATAHISATYDSANNKIVIAYRDEGNSSYGTAIVGTVSGTSISFGAAAVFQSIFSSPISATYDSTNSKIVIISRQASYYGTATVGTVSGTSISFGTAVVFESASIGEFSATFDSTNNKVVIAYQHSTNSNYGTAIVGTVSGTAISFGTDVVFETASVASVAATFDSANNKVVIAYKDEGNSSYGTAIIGTVSGTAISFGTAAVFEAASTTYITATFDSNANKVAIAYKDNGTTYGTAVVGTVSATSISFGTAVVFETASTNNSTATFDSSSNRVVISYTDAGNSSHGTSIAGTISGTSISFGTPVVFEATSTGHISNTFDSVNNKTVTAYQNSATYGSAVVSNIPNLLTIGTDYFVQGDGSLSTTSSTVPAGRALTTSSILLEG